MPDPNQSQKLLGRAAWIGALVILAAIAAAVWLYPRMFKGPLVPSQTVDSGTAGAGVPGNAGGAPVRATPAAPIVFGSVLVNDLRVAEVGRGAPLFVQCVIEGHTTATVALAALDQVRPVVTTPGGREAPAEWEMLPAPQEPLAPGRTVTLTWIARGAIAPGAYEVAVPGAAAALKLAEAGLTGARIDAASLTVRAGAGDPAVAAQDARRILALRGRYDELIAALESALQAQPGRLALGRELVEALSAAGRPADALRHLQGIALRLQQERAAANPGAPEELPDWVILSLADLQQRVKAAGKS